MLSELLRGELGFNGVIISDYSAIEETIAHGVSKDEKEAAYKAITAGVDIDMMSKVYINNLKPLVEENKISEELINKSVLRILNLKNKLGLFENPFSNMDEEEEKRVFLCKENLEQARKIASETFVLLKNKDNILPIKNKNKIALIGPYIDNMGISGSWSMFADRSKIATIKDIFEKRVGKEKISYAKGSEILRQKDINSILKADGIPLVKMKNEDEVEKRLIEEAVNTVKKSEVIVLGVGEHYKQSGEACSRSKICISDIQMKLLNELSKLNIPIITVLFNGRPLELREIEEKSDAILEVWFPGTEGANAVVDVLFGDINPSGKLTISFPQNAGQCPIYYNHYTTGRPHINDVRYVSRYQDIPTKSFYPFGYGLSYSKFKYSNLKLSDNIISKNNKIKVSVKIKNESNKGGYETIQLYIQDLYGSVVRPLKELKDFKKIYFEAFEEKEINFHINIDMLKFWNEKLEYIVEAGEFKVYIGKNSEDNLNETFYYEE